MIEATSCGGVVIHRGKILTLYKSYRNRYEGWVLPKGTVEPGETHEQTALREVMEEAGVRATIVKYIGKSQYNFTVPEEIKKYLDEKGIEYKDYGCDSLDSVDYPVYAKKVAHAILDGECEKGILICGTGIGISITANKFKGIRAAVCTDCFTAEATRLHNDANILALGGRVVGPGLALKIVDTFLNTPFSNDERHIRRINQIETE